MSQHPALPYLRLSEKGKVVTPAEAVRLIRDGDTVATGGFVGIGFAEEIALALEALYLENEGDAPYVQGKPKNLTLVYAAGQGDGKHRGLNHFAHDGLVKRTRSKTNSREVAVALTRRGKSLLTKLIPVAMGLQKQATQKLSQQDLATLKRVLRKMHGNLTRRRSA